MNYLLFPTKGLAEAANTTISSRMGMPYVAPNGYVGTSWGTPEEVVGGWVIVAPPLDTLLTGILGFVVVQSFLHINI